MKPLALIYARPTVTINPGTGILVVRPAANATAAGMVIKEANSQAEENALIAAGYSMIVRLDLLDGYVPGTTTTAAPGTTTTTAAGTTTTTAAGTTTTTAAGTTTTTAAAQIAPTATITTYPLTAVPTGYVQQYGTANPTLVDLPLY